MKKEYKFLIILILVIALGTLIYNYLLEAEVIRNYHIKDFNIDVNINENGDMIVKEDTIYRFNGKYNGITITIPTNVSKEYYDKINSINDSIYLPDHFYSAKGIENVSIYTVENGTKKIFDQVGDADIGARGVYTVSDDGEFTTFKIFEPSKNENKDFVIEYTLKDVAVKHLDSAEYYWNFIGGAVECKINNLDINMNIPGTIINAYTHGNATGKIETTSGKINVKYKNVSAGEFVSVRAVIDQGLVKRSKKISNLNAIELIKQQESSYSEKKDQRLLLNYVGIILSVFLIAYWLMLLYKYEKEVTSISLYADDFEVLDKYNPMIAACIAQNRGMHPRDIIAILINLANKGALKIEYYEAYEGDKKKDKYKLIKNKEFFENEESKSKLDEMENCVIQLFFDYTTEIELTKRLKEIKQTETTVKRLKGLDTIVSSKLESIGANIKTVPTWLTILHNILFVIICIFIVYTVSFNIVLNHITLSVTSAETRLDTFIYGMTIIHIIVIFVLPLVGVLLPLLMKLFHFIKRCINKLAFKLTSKELTNMVIRIMIIFVAIMIFEIIFASSSYVIITTVLFFISLVIICTDNLMSMHSKSVVKDYIMLKNIQDKIENGSLLDEKEVKDVILWNKYFTYAVALGIGNVHQYMKYIPDYNEYANIINKFNSLTENGFMLNSLERDFINIKKEKKFKKIMEDSFNGSGYGGGSSSGGGFSGGGSSFGGGGFSGGGGHGGGRGAF